MALSPPLRRFLWRSLFFVAVSFAFLAGVMAAMVNGRLSAEQAVFILSLGGMVAGVSLVARVMLPHIRRQRDAGLARVLADVTAQKYTAAPDEAWLFMRRGWWTKDRQLTEKGQHVLASGPLPRSRR